MPSPCTESNPWITLSQNEAGQLQVVPVASPRQGNAFQLAPEGIFVPGYVGQTAVPGGGRDGDLWRWENPDDPAIQMMFVYSDEAGGWVFSGGSEIYDEVSASSSRPQTGSPAYADLAAGSTGPTVVAPFAGRYLAHYGARIAASTDNQGAMMSLTYGATAIDGDAVRNANQYSVSVSRRRVITITTPGQTVQAKYKNTSSAGGDATFADRFLFLRPIGPMT